jgi:hypothetical protein
VMAVLKKQTPGQESAPADPSWLRLVRTSAAADDGFEGLAEVVGEEVHGGWMVCTWSSGGPIPGTGA